MLNKNKNILINSINKKNRHKRINKCNNFIKKTFIILIIIIPIVIFAVNITFNKKEPKSINRFHRNYYLYEKNNINNITNYDESIYWNNQKSLNIDKIREEIKELNNVQISYENKEDFIKRENPKVSLVITLYNQEKYVKSIYASILKQELKDIEIIFVNDASSDNSEKIVKELMEKDKRIVYLKNEVNKKAFYSRNKGILEAKGEYILVIDPDDLLINNILIKAYETTKKYNLDIVQFYIMVGYRERPNLWRELKYKSGFLKNNTEVRNIFYNSITRNLCDKFIRREVYVNSVKFMKEELYNENYRINDDDV